MCPTCTHTMHFLGTHFWCPRCGTLKGDHASETPKLVIRCRAFQTTLDMIGLNQMNEWIRSGIAESIHTPENRP